MHPLRTVRRATALCLGSVLASYVLSGCSDDDPRDDAPRLEVAWTAEVRGWDSYGDRPLVADDELLLYSDVDNLGVTAVRLDDGSVAWRAPVGEVCALSEVNEAGMVAVQYGNPAGCDGLAVIDTATGEEAWSKRVRFPEEHATVEGVSIGVSAETVTVRSRCGIERWSVDAGRFLGRLRAQGRKSDALGELCADQATTGTLALVAGRNGLSGYDPDTGKRLWTRQGRGASVAGLYGTDPVVADVALGGVRAVRTIDPATGELGPVIGRPLPEIGQGPDVMELAGDAVVGAHDYPAGGFDGTYATALRGWSLETGAEQWAGAARGDEYLGSDETGTYVGRTVDSDDDGGYGYWLMRRDPDSDAFRTLGWIDDQVLETIRVGDLLLVGGRGKLPDGDYGEMTTAYRLPGDTTDVPVPSGKEKYVAPSWAEGDVRPDPVVDPCTGVSSATLRTLGFDRAARLPAPVGCRWEEADYALSVQVRTYTPGDGTTAADAAGAAIEDVFLPAHSGKELVEVDGVADEAWAWSARSVAVPAHGHGEQHLFTPSITSTDVVMLVRSGNVVAEVTYVGGVQQTPGLPLQSARVEEGVRVATLEALETATGSAPEWSADPGPDAAVTTLPDLCRAAEPEVAGTLPGVAPEDLSARGEDRLRGCLWQQGEYDDYVQVVAHAVGPDALTGASATEAAKASYERSVGDGTAAPVRVKGADEAGAYGEFDGYDDTRRLTVRRGNVVLVVQVNLEDRDRQGADVLATRTAERVLAQL